MNDEYKILQLQVDLDFEKTRLDHFLTEKEVFLNRSKALQAIQNQQVSLEGKFLKPSYKLKGGELLEIKILQSKTLLPSFDIDIPIVYEDEDVLVIDKPAGLVVHPAPGHENDTLVNALKDKKKLSPGSSPLRPGIVHRLDKDTSGLLVLAKNQKSETDLIEQFKNKKVTRVYWAISSKIPKKNTGKITSYLVRHPKLRKKFISVSEFQTGAKKAITNYRVLKVYQQNLAWVEFSLETGRTHQIRVHSSSHLFPVLGDMTYSSFRHKTARPRRMALHAQFLGFQQPTTKKKLEFTSSWPDDLKKMIENLDEVYNNEDT